MKMLITCLAVALMSTSVFARTRHVGVQNLGTTKLSFGSDYESVMVKSCAVRGFYVDALKIRVTNNFANIDLVSIMFGNGEIMDLPVRSTFSINSETRWIDLGGLRCIRSIEVYGGTVGLPIRQARVTLLGDAFTVN